MKRGFSASLVTEIIKKAKIEPPVFYHRYKDLDEFYSEFVKGYDYWFSEIADEAMKCSDDPKVQYIALMEGLQDSLKDRSPVFVIGTPKFQDWVAISIKS